MKSVVASLIDLNRSKEEEMFRETGLNSKRVIYKFDPCREFQINSEFLASKNSPIEGSIKLIFFFF